MIQEVMGELWRLNRCGIQVDCLHIMDLCAGSKTVVFLVEVLFREITGDVFVRPLRRPVVMDVTNIGHS